jgi:hypothetical protein
MALYYYTAVSAFIFVLVAVGHLVRTVQTMGRENRAVLFFDVHVMGTPSRGGSQYCGLIDLAPPPRRLRRLRAFLRHRSTMLAKRFISLLSNFEAKSAN